jgi:glyoxylate reductase
MARPKVFVTRKIPEAGLSMIRAACDVDVWQEPLPPPPAALQERVRDCVGLLSLLTERIDGPLFDAAPRLRVVSNYAVGYNNIDVAEATRRGICVGNTPSVLTEATADLALALLIAAARRLGEARDYASSGSWKTWEPLGHIGQDLLGRTIGIVGMGRIGTALARRCRGGWNMRVLYHDVHANVQAEREIDARLVGLDDLLAQSDFVSVHADLNETTRGMFDAAAFRKMKRTAVFVNTARGPLVVERDLVEALRQGVIFSAGLDVTDPEPPAGDNPLLSLPNAFVVPHIASATTSSRNGMAEIAADNLVAGVLGQPLRAWVNPEVGVYGRR